MPDMETPDIDAGSSTTEGDDVAESSGRVPLSQRDYVEKPYVESAWEVIGERAEDTGFSPIKLSVIRTGNRRHDPMFEDFTGALRPEGSDVFHSPNGSKPLEEESDDDGGSIDWEQVEEKLSLKFEEGRTLGFEEGQQSAREEIAKRYEELNARASSIKEGIRAELAGFFETLEARALEFSMKVALRILSTTAELRPEYITDVIRDGLKSLGAARPLRIRISEQDYEFISVVGLPPELSAEELGISYVPDEAVHSGCVIETDFGEVDLELEHMWARLKEQLSEVYKK